MKEKFVKLLNNPRRVPVAVGIIAFGAGVGVGYILAKRRLPRMIEITSEEGYSLSPGDEIIEVKQNIVRPPPVVIPAEYHPEFNKPLEENQTPMSVIHNTDDEAIVPEYDITETIDKVNDEETLAEDIRERRSLFATQSTDEWNYKSEIEQRNPSQPYIIHKDEFFEDSMQYSQVTFTYYAGDNIMVDEDDSPIYNHNTVVGPLKFGHGSTDPNVVYVRNDKRKAEYEILYDSGMYSVEVLGLEIDNNERVKDLKHSKTRKFRPE